MSVRGAISVEISIDCSECGLFAESLREYPDGAAKQFEEAGWANDGIGGALCPDCARLKIESKDNHDGEVE